MKSNREIRSEAWTLLWRERWFFRLAAAWLLLASICAAVLAGAAAAFAAAGIETLSDFNQAKLEAARQGLGYAVPSMAAMRQMALASLFEMFLNCLFVGILSVGFAKVGLMAARHDVTGWFRDVFVGFSRPFGMLWTMLRVSLGMFVWLMVAMLPIVAVASQVAPSVAKALALGHGIAGNALISVGTTGVMLWLVYRYRAVWYLKADRPDSGALAVVREAVAMMRGAKLRALSLDCSYAAASLPLLLLAPALAFFALRATERLGNESTTFDVIAFVVFALATGLALSVLGAYMTMGHAIFYREQCAEMEASGASAGAEEATEGR